MSENGKGDTRRPQSVPKEVFESNWEQTFSKKEEPTEVPKLETLEDAQAYAEYLKHKWENADDRDT